MAILNGAGSRAAYFPGDRVRVTDVWSKVALAETKGGSTVELSPAHVSLLGRFHCRSFDPTVAL